MTQRNRHCSQTLFEPHSRVFWLLILLPSKTRKAPHFCGNFAAVARDVHFSLPFVLLFIFCGMRSLFSGRMWSLEAATRCLLACASVCQVLTWVGRVSQLRFFLSIRLFFCGACVTLHWWCVFWTRCSRSRLICVNNLLAVNMIPGVPSCMKCYLFVKIVPGCTSRDPSVGCVSAACRTVQENGGFHGLWMLNELILHLWVVFE